MCPRVGCLREERDGFWADLDEVVRGVPKGGVVVGAGFGGRVGGGGGGEDVATGREVRKGGWWG